MPAKSYENILLIADPIEAEKYLAQSLLSKNGSYLVIDPDGIPPGKYRDEHYMIHWDIEKELCVASESELKKEQD